MSGLTPIPTSPDKGFETPTKKLTPSNKQEKHEVNTHLERRITSLIQDGDKQAKHISTLLEKPDLKEKDLIHLIEEFRDLRLIDIQLKHLKKRSNVQHIINQRLNEHAALHNRSTTFHDKYYLEGDADFNYLASHPDEEKAAREKLYTTSSEGWKHKIMQKFTSDNTARRCTALMKKDIVDALTSRNEQALANAKHNVAKLWTLFPTYMAAIKQFDPKFFQLHEMLQEYVKADAEPSRKRIHFAPKHELEQSWTYPDTEFESAEKVKPPKEKRLLQYQYEDSEEFEKVTTTLRNTLKSELHEFPKVLDQALEKISNKSIKKRLPRELTLHLIRFVRDSAFLLTFLETQKPLSTASKQEIHILREYMELVDKFISSCERIEPQKKGMKTSEGRHVNKFDLKIAGSKVEQLRGELAELQQRYPI